MKTLYDFDKYLIFAEQLYRGAAPTAAAKAAGLKPYVNVPKLVQHVHVQQVLQLLRDVGGGKHHVSRAEVHDMVLEAYQTARVQGDAGAMVRATAELNRMNGYYEPERKRIDLNVSVNEQRELLRTLSDAELLELAAPRGEVIEGEATETGDDAG